jgi:sodium-dependent dicarboxylate transporter 2/3/5
MGGGGGRRLVFGFMATSALMSMWISNSATTLMLLPIVMAVVEQTENPRLTKALLLGVAYAASVGGIGTPVGTPPNLIFMQNYYEATGVEVTFLQWMSWTMPVVVVMIPLTAFWLTRKLQQEEQIELPSVGTWRAEEVRTLLIFALTALLWVTRKDPFGGWSSLAHLPDANDASVALLAVVAMFLVPNGRGGHLLDWETAVRIPWGVLLLFSSGIVLARAFVSSGLSRAMGDALAGWGHLPALALVAITCLSITFLTEVTSNTATANLLLPILAAAATSLDVEPRLLMVPATISASFAFMLPVATAPNAVVFSSGKLTVRTMAAEGVVLNLLGVVVVASLCYVLFG